MQAYKYNLSQSIYLVLAHPTDFKRKTRFSITTCKIRVRIPQARRPIQYWLACAFIRRGSIQMMPKDSKVEGEAGVNALLQPKCKLHMAVYRVNTLYQIDQRTALARTWNLWKRRMLCPRNMLETLLSRTLRIPYVTLISHFILRVRWSGFLWSWSRYNRGRFEHENRLCIVRPNVSQ